MRAVNRALAGAFTVALGLALAPSINSRHEAVAQSEVCSPSHREGCLYSSDLDYKPGTVDGIVLVDEDRHDYRVPLLVRYPIGATGPRPVVIWHHGGSPSEKGKDRSEEWGKLLAKSGYVVIHPSRVVPDDITPLIPECQRNGFYPDENACAFWIANQRYGPQNTSFVIDHLSDIEAADPALRGLLDHDTIAVGGHSAGTTSVLANAGAWQQWTTHRYEEPVPEPIAFLAASPQGPTYAGFNSGFQSKDGDAGWTEHSFVHIDRPLMSITGLGDETNEPPESRATAFLTSAGAGNKLMTWDTDPEAVHETMNIHKCDSQVQAHHCRWIGSAGLAYFDAVVRGRSQAARWLASDALKILTNDAIELYSR